MTSTELAKIRRLPKNQKIRLVQTLWDDIAKDNESVKPLKEHLVLLEKRLKKVEKGKTKFTDWDKLKKKYFGT